MKVQMKVASASPHGIRNEGGIYEVPDDEAAQLINGHYAIEAPAAATAIETEMDGWSEDLAGRIAELEAEISTGNEEKTALEAQVTEKDARIAELEAEIATLTAPAAEEASGSETPDSTSGTPETATVAAPETATAPPQRGTKKDEEKS